MKRQKTSIRDAVEREDEDLASKFTPQDLNAAISRAVVEISKEQEHLDVVTHVVAVRSGRRLRDSRASRTSSSPFRDLDSRRRTCPRRAIETSQSIPGIRRNRRCVGQSRVDIPRGVARESRRSWSSNSIRVEEFIKRETVIDRHHSRTSN